MIHFIIVSTVSMAVLLFAYHVLLENEKMHRFNRFFLLSSVIISLLLPFISFTPAAVNNGLTIVLPTLPAVSKEVSTTGSGIAYLPILLGTLYGVVTALLAVRFFKNVNRLLRRVRNNILIESNHLRLVLVEDEILPHTFLNYIFINKGDYYKGAVEKELFLHEQVHAQQKHTLDILFIELLKTVFWFNPILYYYKTAIQLNHEYLADEAVLKQSVNVAEYQKLLLEKAAFCTTVSLASNINFSITKKRFIMMTKTTSKVQAVLKQIAIVPLLAGVTIISCSEPENKTVQETSAEKIVKLPKTENPLWQGNAAQAGFPSREFSDYVVKNINLPKVDKDLKAKVYVAFVVNADGTISDVKVHKDPGYGIGKEIERVVSNAPKQSPHIVDGKPAKAQFTMPVVINIKA